MKFLVCVIELYNMNDIVYWLRIELNIHAIVHTWIK